MNDDIDQGMTFAQIDQRIVGDDYVFEAIDKKGRRLRRVVPIRGVEKGEWVNPLDL